MLIMAVGYGGVRVAYASDLSVALTVARYCFLAHGYGITDTDSYEGTRWHG